MIRHPIGVAFALAAFAGAPLGAPMSANAQTVQGGTSGSVSQGDLSVGAGTSGSITPTDGGRAVQAGGTGSATAADGGVVSSDTSAKVNERRGMSRSVSQARDDDENAIARSRTMVLPNDTVRSRTVTRYKEAGKPPVREMTTTVATPEGTTTKTK